jgi:PAS domain S-box-containing protein
VTAGKPLVALEGWLRRKDGSLVLLEINGIPFFDAAGELAGYRGTTRDITDSKRAEEALRESEEKFSKAFHDAPVLMAISERESGRYLDVNEKCLALTGYTREEIIGRTSDEIGWTSTEDRLEREELLQRDGRIVDLETKLRKKNGELLHCLYSGHLITLRDRKRLLSISQDITALKRAEEERRKLEVQMQRAQKLESLGALAGGIAHDFNNLLTVILGHADLALVEMAPGSPGCEDLREIGNAARRAAELCRQMLAYAGRGRFLVEPVNLSRLVQELVHLLSVSLSKKALCRCHLGEDLPAVMADPAQLRQIVMNLVINASEAIGDNEGVIGITTGAMDCTADDLRSDQLVEPVPPGRYVFLEVTDTGCGMAEETRTRIFDPFFTTKFTGRGLGLAAVLGIVRTHQGTLKVTSERGRGTTFRVLFPATARTATPEAAGATAPLRQGAGTVLLVDDEEPVRGVVSQMLERCGFRPLVACDGREAVELFRRHGAEIVCVLLDLAMPRMDGAETFRELRQLRPDVRVILASGYNDFETAQRFPEGALAGVIEKPYQLQSLSAKLREVLAPGKTSPAAS